MKILLAAATEMEMAHFKKVCRGFDMLNLDYCTTGIGVTATTFHLQKSIMTSKPKIIIQIGLAGSFSTLHAVGKAVVVKNEIIGDMGVFEKDGYKDIFDLGLESRDIFPYKNGQLINHDDSILECTGLDCVSAITVNEISTSKEKINLFSNRYHAAIETMEGAALHFVCIMNNIRFIQIRGLSNYIGERDKNKWEIKKAMNAAIDGCENVFRYLENKLDK